jgi:hypothetical protein
MMDRTIWIFRIIAFVILLVFAMLMINLYSRLHKLQGTSIPKKTECSSTSSALLPC